MVGVKRAYILGPAAIALLASCMAPPTSTSGPEPEAPDSRASATRAAVPSVTSVPAPTGTALAALGRLPIKGRAPRAGYARSQFGERWTDDNDDVWGHNGCDTRNDILRRDLAGVVLRSGGCRVSSGVLVDPYTGATVHFVGGPGTSSQVQIDHVVPLANAWQTGAQQWTERRRRDFANDPLELLATEGDVNDAKGDGDAATWLPPNKAFRCAYAARMVAVKLTWRLWVTPAEHDALARILAGCAAEPLPGEPGRR